MQAVERLSSYITSVSGPFHPFGGAVDIIVVEQQDGSFKSSPWYVRFGKFLGVLKTREMVVKIFVNGQEAGFHMYLDHKGEAFFLKECDDSEDEEAASSPRSSSGDEVDGDGQPRKSHVESCETESISKIDVENGKIVGRTDSRRSTVFGLAFGKKPVKEEENERSHNLPRLNSLEHAEIAADLLETKWSTNLPVTNRGLGKGQKTDEEACKTEDLQQEGTEGNSGGVSTAAIDVQEEHLGEPKVEFSPSVRTHGELLEVYSSENGGIVNRHEIFSDIPAEADIPQLETSFQDSRLIRERIVDIQSSEFALLSNKNEGVSDEAGDSLTSGNFMDECLGRENASYIFYETIQSSTVRIGVADDRTESTSPLVRSEQVENTDGILVESAEHLPKVESASSQEALSREEHVGDRTDHSSKSLMRTVDGGPNDVVPNCVLGCEGAPSESLKQGTGDEVEELEKENSLPVILESSLLSHERQTDTFGGNTVESEASQAVSSYVRKETKDIAVAGSGTIIGSEDQESLAVVEGMETNASYPSIEVSAVVGSSLCERSNLDKIASPGSLVLSASEDEHVAFSDVDNYAAGVLPSRYPIEEEAGSEENLFLELEGNDVEQELLDVDGEEGSPNCLPEAPVTNPINIPIRKKLEESDRLVRSLPNVPSQIHHLDMSDNYHPLSSSVRLNSQRFDACIPKEGSPVSAKFEQISPISTKLEEGSTSEHVQAEPTSEDASEQSRESICGTSAEKEKPNIEMSLCRHLLVEGMGAEAASKAFDSEKVDLEKFTALGPSIVKNKKLIVRIFGRYFPWNVAAPIILGIVSFDKDQIFESEGIRVEKLPASSGGQWGLWPFRFSRSRTMKSDRNTVDETNQNTVDETNQNTVDETNQNTVGETKEDKTTIHSEGVSTTENEKPRPRQTKPKEHFITPSPEQLSSLNLKEGRNLVSFCFESAMLGKQQVDARIYLWKWDTRIVISDVDGTITKSDVLGQFMPLVGKDWSQTGVAHLFSSIKDNGYEFIFLSARAIAQAYLTRQFLFNLKQDGKSLPDGPVVISPDGLFPSLYREVIRRAPHEFKIACLEEIRALFPPECNPFYAGFGNRHTDEISYLKVGIPKGKIFTINPRGQVAVNNLVDTRSYTSLNALVNGMFPPMAAVEQEEFNNWNYWRLPLPDID